MSQDSDILQPEAGVSLDGGRVTLDVPLGAGGMGSVWRGRLAYRVSPVAVKLLRCDGLDPADRATLVARLRDEATAAARVIHPNLVRILASGDCPQRGPYIVYELMEGGSLEEHLKAGPLPWREVEARLAPQLLGALDALHSAGIVHRDVKPDNVFIADDGRFVLGDLGLATFEGRGARTEEGAVVGTPGYLAPERITSPGGPTGPTADVYAAAMVLIRAAIGRLPFRETAPAALVSEQVRREVRTQDLVALGLPSVVAATLAGAVSRDPRTRPPSAGALLHGLSRSGTVPPVAAPTLTVAVRGAFPGRAHAVQRSAFPGRRAPLMVGVAVVLLVAVLHGVRRDGPVEENERVSAFADLTSSLAASAPFVDDKAAGPLWSAVATLESRPDSGGDAFGESLRSLARAVGRVASTTSPVFLMVEDALRGSSAPGGDAASRGERLLSAQLSYASTLLSDPGRAPSSLRLLTLLTARVGPLLLVLRQGQESGGSLDTAAVAAYGVLSSLPGKARISSRGRSLAAVLDLLLSRATPSGEVPSVVAAQALGLLAADPSLDPEVASLAATLGVTLATEYSSESVAALAAPALGRRERRRQEIADLRAGRIDDMVTVVGDDASPEAERMRRVVSGAIDDWYRVLPAASLVASVNFAEPSFEQWALSSDILLRAADVRRLRPLARLATGPFSTRPLAGRTSVLMTGLAEAAASGDPMAKFLLHRNLDDWLKGLNHARLVSVQPFVAAVRDHLKRSSGGRSGLLSMDAILAALAGRLAESAELGTLACNAALDAFEAAGSSVPAEDLQALVDCLSRVQRVALTDHATEVLRGLRERTARLLARLRSFGKLSPAVQLAVEELTEELGKPLSPLFFGGGRP